ncbi:MAG: hypothetical protein M4579_004868 [Chaenotheca gracillima]|nr:MAG: hypothetical protein M4579_004868 [Chaenotheca gracillima]
MTTVPSSEEPEAFEKSLTPALVSPLPVHLPEPSNIPVLQNQMDPVFNDTATHLEPNQSISHPAAIPNNEQTSGEMPDEAKTSSVYGETADGVGNQIIPKEGQGEEDTTDDYAMSLDYDDDDGHENGYSIANQDAIPTRDDAPVASTNENEKADEVSHNPAPMATYDDNMATSTDAQSNPSLSTHTLNEKTEASPILDEPTKNVNLPAASTEPRDGSFQFQTNGENSMDVAQEGVNFQTLLDNLSSSATTAPSAEGQPTSTTDFSAVNGTLPNGEQDQSSTSGLPSYANLPPRPPPQDKPTLHPNYSPGDDIRSYHPHNPTPLGSSNFSTSPSSSYHPPGVASPVIAAGAPGTASQPGSGLPPPPVATFQQAQASTAQQPESPVTQSSRHPVRQERYGSRSTTGLENEEDQAPWGPEIQKIYDQFLHDERTYVTEGQWDRFPPNSRLFIGNLPTEKVTKRDLFHIFHRHGKLAQVSIKQAYGFIQFLDSESCHRALQNEQGQNTSKYRSLRRTPELQAEVEAVMEVLSELALHDDLALLTTLEVATPLKALREGGSGQIEMTEAVIGEIVTLQGNVAEMTIDRLEIYPHLEIGRGTATEEAEIVTTDMTDPGDGADLLLSGPAARIVDAVREAMTAQMKRM